MKILETFVKIVNTGSILTELSLLYIKFRPKTFQIYPFLWKRELLFEAVFFLSLCIHFSLWKRALLLSKVCAQMSLSVVKRRETAKWLSNKCRQITRAIPKIRYTSGLYQHCPKFFLKTYISNFVGMSFLERVPLGNRRHLRHIKILVNTEISLNTSLNFSAIVIIVK